MTSSDERPHSPIPDRMQATTLDSFGGPEVMRLSSMETPRPGPGEVLIQVAAAGLNRADIIQRKGFYPPPPGASEILGMEVAGTIVACSPDADARWAIGDQVCALVPGGGYAEYCVAHSGSCLPIPAGLTLEQAASLPEATMTVWANLFDRKFGPSGRIFPGDRFLMQGGTSGVGTMAIQTARAFGAKVASTAGSAEKCSFLLELGCERAWNYREEDWAAAAKDWSPSGIDVILDMVGGDYFAKHLELLAADGRLVHIAFSRGAEVTLDLRKLMTKRLTVTGSTLRSRPGEEKRRLRDQVEQHLWPLIAQGTIRPIVDRVYPLADAAEAHRRMESSAHIGKILLSVGSQPGA